MQFKKNLLWQVFYTIQIRLKQLFGVFLTVYGTDKAWASYISLLLS